MASNPATDDPTPGAWLDERRSGVLLHLTSLPGAGACGDLGEHAYYFVDFLKNCGFSVWQMLPVGPTLVERSPYQASSVHAGNPRLIALKPFLERGFILGLPDYTIEEPDAGKEQALRYAWAGFQTGATEAEREDLTSFVAENAYWLEDYALFRALREEQERQWWTWPIKLRDRDPKALAEASERLAGELDYIRFEQHLFFSSVAQPAHLCQRAGRAAVRRHAHLRRPRQRRGLGAAGDFDLDRRRADAQRRGGAARLFLGHRAALGNPLYDWKRVTRAGSSSGSTACVPS